MQTSNDLAQCSSAYFSNAAFLGLPTGILQTSNPEAMRLQLLSTSWQAQCLRDTADLQGGKLSCKIAEVSVTETFAGAVAVQELLAGSALIEAKRSYKRSGAAEHVQSLYFQLMADAAREMEAVHLAATGSAADAKNRHHKEKLKSNFNSALQLVVDKYLGPQYMPTVMQVFEDLVGSFEEPDKLVVSLLQFLIQAVYMGFDIGTQAQEVLYRTAEQSTASGGLREGTCSPAATTGAITTITTTDPGGDSNSGTSSVCVPVLGVVEGQDAAAEAAVAKAPEAPNAAGPVADAQEAGCDAQPSVYEECSAQPSVYEECSPGCAEIFSAEQVSLQGAMLFTAGVNAVSSLSQTMQPGTSPTAASADDALPGIPPHLRGHLAPMMLHLAVAGLQGAALLVDNMAISMHAPLPGWGPAGLAAAGRLLHHAATLKLRRERTEGPGQDQDQAQDKLQGKGKVPAPVMSVLDAEPDALEVLEMLLVGAVACKAREQPTSFGLSVLTRKTRVSGYCTTRTVHTSLASASDSKASVVSPSSVESSLSPPPSPLPPSAAAEEAAAEEEEEEATATAAEAARAGRHSVSVVTLPGLPPAADCGWEHLLSQASSSMSVPMQSATPVGAEQPDNNHGCHANSGASCSQQQRLEQKGRHGERTSHTHLQPGVCASDASSSAMPAQEQVVVGTEGGGGRGNETGKPAFGLSSSGSSSCAATGCSSSSSSRNGTGVGQSSSSNGDGSSSSGAGSMDEPLLSALQRGDVAAAALLLAAGVAAGGGAMHVLQLSKLTTYKAIWTLLRAMRKAQRRLLQARGRHLVLGVELRTASKHHKLLKRYLTAYGNNEDAVQHCKHVLPSMSHRSWDTPGHSRSCTGPNYTMLLATHTQLLLYEVQPGAELQPCRPRMVQPPQSVLQPVHGGSTSAWSWRARMRTAAAAAGGLSMQPAPGAGVSVAGNTGCTSGSGTSVSTAASSGSSTGACTAGAGNTTASMLGAHSTSTSDEADAESAGNQQEGADMALSGSNPTFEVPSEQHARPWASVQSRLRCSSSSGGSSCSEPPDSSSGCSSGPDASFMHGACGDDEDGVDRDDPWVTGVDLASQAARYGLPSDFLDTIAKGRLMAPRGDFGGSDPRAYMLQAMAAAHNAASSSNSAAGSEQQVNGNLSSILGEVIPGVHTIRPGGGGGGAGRGISMAGPAAAVAQHIREGKVRLQKVEPIAQDCWQQLNKIKDEDVLEVIVHIIWPHVQRIPSGKGGLCATIHRGVQHSNPKLAHLLMTTANELSRAVGTLQKLTHLALVSSVPEKMQMKKDAAVARCIAYGMTRQVRPEVQKNLRRRFGLDAKLLEELANTLEHTATDMMP